jgi:hypothetical protein
MNGASVSNATSRRTLLKASLGVSAASAMGRSVWGHASTVSYYKAVFDERFAAGLDFAAGAAARGIATAAIRGDITRLFFDDLDLRWRQGPIALAGYTLPESLFCLDLLARDRGMRLTHSVAEPSVEEALAGLDGAVHRGRATVQTSSSDRRVPVFWIIAPRAEV